jgi:hypothetical protein
MAECLITQLQIYEKKSGITVPGWERYTPNLANYEAKPFYDVRYSLAGISQLIQSGDQTEVRYE